MPNKNHLIKHFIEMDDEAFSWLVLCITGDKQPQIWPDGTGGFKDGATIDKVKNDAKVWLKEYAS